MRNFLSIVRNTLIFGGLAACFLAANLGLIPDGRRNGSEELHPSIRHPASGMIIREALLERPKSEPAPVVAPRKKPRPANSPGVAGLRVRPEPPQPAPEIYQATE